MLRTPLDPKRSFGRVGVIGGPCPKGATFSSDPTIELVIAGEASQSAQKVHNLLAALAYSRRTGSSFSPSRHRAPANWLEQLIRPIALYRAGDQWLSLANPNRPQIGKPDCGARRHVDSHRRARFAVEPAK